MEKLESGIIQVHPGMLTRVPEECEGWRIAFIEVCNLTFGYPSRDLRTYTVFYDPCNTFNISPPQPAPLTRLADVLEKVERPTVDKCVDWPMGYRWHDIEQYCPELLPSPKYFKLSWKLPAPKQEDYEWIHPGGPFLLTDEEIALVKGDHGTHIHEWLLQQVEYHRKGAWGDLDIESEYSAFDLNGPKWINTPCKGVKHFDLTKFHANYRR